MAKQLMVEAAPTATTEVPNDFPTDTSRGKTKGRRSPSPPEEERNHDDSTVSTHNESSSHFLVVGGGSSSTTCSPSSGASLNKAYYYPTSHHHHNSHDRNHRQLPSNIPSSSSSSPSCLFDHKPLYLTAPTSPEPQTPETAMGSFSSNGSPPSFQISSTTSSTSPPSSLSTSGSTPTMTGTTRMAPPPGLTMMLHHHGDGDFDDDHDAKLTPFFPQGSEYFLETNHLLHSTEFGTLTHPEPTLDVPVEDDDDDQFILSELPPGIFHGLDLEEQQQQQTVPELTFDSAHQEQFAALSVDEQTLVRQYCNDAARTAKGFIRNPQAFYAKVLDRYRRQGSLPVFVLPKTQQQDYEALSQSDQSKAKLFCLDAAKTLSNTGGAIRNPSSYFGRVFKTFLEQQRHLATGNGNNVDIPLKQSHGDKVTNNNTLPPKDTKQYSNAPEFILSKDRQKKFTSLSLVQQDSVRKSCLKAAHSLVSSGHSVRHPAAYYSRVFDSLFSNDTLLIHHHGSGGVKTNHLPNNSDHNPSTKSLDECGTTTNITTTDTTTNTTATRVPAFILPPSPRRQFQSLSVSEQENAREFCLQLAATVLAAGSTIRSPAAFYGSAFHRYRQTLRRNSSTSTTAAVSGTCTTATSADAPFHNNKNNTLAPFTLTNNQKKNFDSLSDQEQQIAKQYCLDAATSSMQSGKGIRDPTRFYSWALHCYFEEHNLTKIATTTTTTLEQANNVDNDSNNSMIYEDLPEPTLEISAGSNQPTTITTPVAPETATQTELFNKIESLTNEITTLQSQTSKIDARRKTAEDPIRKYEMQHGQLLEMLELAAMKYSALLDEKKHLEEMYKLEGENYLKLTATLTSITEELMEERKAKQEIQNRWQEEQDKCRQYEAEIEQLKAELGRISLF